MRFVTDMSKGILGAEDSPVLWTEIINHIPDSVLLKPGVKILCVACGHATEAVILAKRMLALGLSKEQVNDAIWLIDRFTVFTNHAKIKYGFKNIITCDFMEWETKMKFSAVVSNPPFQDPTGQNTLYPKFYAKARTLLEDDGYMAMITPPAIIPGLWGLKNPDGIKMPAPVQIEHVAVGDHVKQHFAGVASDFCYFVIKNTAPNNNSVSITTDGGTVIANGPLFPRNVGAADLAIAQSILNKCFKFAADPYGATSGDHGVSAKADPKGKDLAVESIATDGTIKTRNITWLKPHAHYGKPKVLLPMYGKTAVVDYSNNMVSAAQEKLRDGTKLTGHNVITVLTNSNSESESLITILESRLQRFFNGITNETRSPYVNFLKNFAGAPLTQKYTDATLESTMGLTAAESKWLNANY